MRPALLLLLLLLPVRLAAQETLDAPVMARLVDGPEFKAAFARASSGEVELGFDVGPDGVVVNPRVLHSQPHGVFDRAALSLVAGRRLPLPSRARVGEILRDQRIVVRFRDAPDPASKIQLGE